MREIVKHTPELAQLVVGNGGVASLVDYVAEASGNNRLPGIMALGYIAAFSETLALSVIAEKALPPLVQVSGGVQPVVVVVQVRGVIRGCKEGPEYGDATGEGMASAKRL